MRQLQEVTGDLVCHKRNSLYPDESVRYYVSTFFTSNVQNGSTRWSSWLRHCATRWKVAGSIHNAVFGIFHWHNPSAFWQKWVPGIFPWPVSGADNLTTFVCRFSRHLGASACWNPHCLSRPVTGIAKNISKMLTRVMPFVALFLIQCIALVLACTFPYLRTNVLMNIVVVLLLLLIWWIRDLILLYLSTNKCTYIK